MLISLKKNPAFMTKTKTKATLVSLIWHKLYNVYKHIYSMSYAINHMIIDCSKNRLVFRAIQI